LGFSGSFRHIGRLGGYWGYFIQEKKVVLTDCFMKIVADSIFVSFSLVFFKNETFRLKHLIGFIFLILAVYFIFKK
jgi:uncharacterized protein (DUF486 family)